MNDKEKIEIRVLETANRLRLVQVDFADENEQTRIDYIRDEIERVLKDLLPTERKFFLEGLLKKFPTGSFVSQSDSVDQEIKSRSTGDDSESKNVDFLLQSLLEIAPMLSDEQKVIIGKGLEEAGLRPTVKQEKSFDLGQELKAKLQIGDGSNLDSARLTELSAMLIDFISKLEPLVWNTWRTLSPRSTIRQQDSLAKTLGQFLSDKEVSVNKVDDDLKVFQRLLAALTSAVGRAGDQFAKHHLARFSPSEISALVRMEPGSVFISHEVKCWRKYVELAETLNEDSIEMEIRKAIVDYVESLTKGVG